MNENKNDPIPEERAILTKYFKSKYEIFTGHSFEARGESPGEANETLELAIERAVDVFETEQLLKMLRMHFKQNNHESLSRLHITLIQEDLDNPDFDLELTGGLLEDLKRFYSSLESDVGEKRQWFRDKSLPPPDLNDPHLVDYGGLIKKLLNKKKP